MSKPNIENAYQEGRDAHHNNIDINENPYPEDSAEWWQWFYGWRDSVVDSI